MPGLSLVAEEEMGARPDLRTVVCPTCDGPADVRSRHVVVDGSSVRIFCSADCKEGARVEPYEILEVVSADEAEFQKPSLKSRMTMGGALVGCLLLLDAPSRMPPDAPRSTRIVATLQGLVAPQAFAAPATPVAPEQPAGPTVEEQWASVLSQDAWIHPLDGPVRRMPKTDSRVFGADRPGDRPIECKHGHCGVDIGGEAWGEPVHAAHDGIVNRVQRGPNEDHGGQYVRIAHRDGTVFTQYFHLAAIPRWIVVGKPIKAGDVVGLVGDTGVKISPAHLHFTVSVKPEPNGPELYIDPEPLIALWPLRLPDAGGGKLSAAQAPGVVHGSVGSRRAIKSKRAVAGTAAAAVSDAAESESSNL